MAAISSDSLLDGIRWQQEEYTVAEQDKGMLTQADFFALLTQELANQDPTKPVDNNEMISQMTAFSTTDGISELNKSFETFASSMTSSQALQASSLVGRSVLVEDDVFAMAEDGEAIKGKLTTEEPASNVIIYVESLTGEIVQTVEVGSVEAGDFAFTWNGERADGDPAAAGIYRFQIAGLVDGEGAELQAMTYRNVESVKLAGAGGSIVLNLNGGDSMTLADVVEVSDG